jgi:hypothetical protein
MKESHFTSFYCLTVRTGAYLSIAWSMVYSTFQVAYAAIQVSSAALSIEVAMSYINLSRLTNFGTTPQKVLAPTPVVLFLVDGM